MGITKLSKENEEFMLQVIKHYEADKKWKEEGKVEGKIEGKIETRQNDILDFLQDLGEIPKQLKNTINSQCDIFVLSKWLKLAARSNSIDEFWNRIKE